MKLKKARIRTKDLHNGKIIYVASLEHGIDKYTIKGKPYLVKSVDALFVDVVSDWRVHISLQDAGIIDNIYNDRRTFSSMKQAERYVEFLKIDPDSISEREERIEDKHSWKINYLACRQ